MLLEQVFVVVLLFAAFERAFELGRLSAVLAIHVDLERLVLGEHFLTSGALVHLGLSERRLCLGALLGAT